MLDLSGLVPVTRHYCPRCSATDITREAQPHTRYHACAALGGLSAPMLREGDDARQRVNVREDYVGREDVQTDGEGRPISSITTEYADGRNDTAVYAPTAHMEG